MLVRSATRAFAGERERRWRAGYFFVFGAGVAGGAPASPFEDVAVPVADDCAGTSAFVGVAVKKRIVISIAARRLVGPTPSISSISNSTTFLEFVILCYLSGRCI